jgi:hypothetical protein
MSTFNPLEAFNSINWNKYEDMSDSEFESEMSNMMSQMFSTLSTPKKNPDLTPTEKKFILDHEKFLERMEIVKQLEAPQLVDSDSVIYPRGTTFVNSAHSELTLSLPDSTEGNFKNIALIDNYSCKSVNIVSRKSEFKIDLKNPNLLLKFEKGKYIKV